MHPWQSFLKRIMLDNEQYLIHSLVPQCATATSKKRRIDLMETFEKEDSTEEIETGGSSVQGQGKCSLNSLN